MVLTKRLTNQRYKVKKKKKNLISVRNQFSTWKAGINFMKDWIQSWLKISIQSVTNEKNCSFIDNSLNGFLREPRFQSIYKRRGENIINLVRKNYDLWKVQWAKYSFFDDVQKLSTFLSGMTSRFIASKTQNMFQPASLVSYEKLLRPQWITTASPSPTTSQGVACGCVRDEI